MHIPSRTGVRCFKETGQLLVSTDSIVIKEIICAVIRNFI